MIPLKDPGDPLRRRLGIAIIGRKLRGSDALRGLALELEKTEPETAAVYFAAAETLQAVEMNLKGEFHETERTINVGLP